MRARAEFTAVLELRRELGDRHGEANARHALENLDEATEGAGGAAAGTILRDE